MPSEMSELSAADKLTVLSRAVGLLASSTEFEATLANTIAACLPALGDFGFFDVVVEPGTVRRTSAAHADPRIEAILAPTTWVKSERTDVNLCALSSGQPGLHAHIDDAWYQSVAVNEGHLAVLRDLAFVSMVTVPMRYRDELVGSLTLFFGTSGRHHTEADVAFASDLAALCVPAVVNARLVEKHRRVVEQLRQSEERLRLAADAGQLGIWDWNVVDDTVTLSAGMAALYGLADGKAQDFRDLVHPEDRPRVQAAIDKAVASGTTFNVEYRIVQPNGSHRWLASRGDAVRDPDTGATTRMLGAMIDITQRVALLEAERSARVDAERARHRLETLIGAGDRLTSHSLAPEDALKQIGNVVVSSLADWCRVDLIDDDGVLRHAYTHGHDPRLIERAVYLARRYTAPATTPGSAAWVAAQGKPHHATIDDALFTQIGDHEMAAFVREVGLREILTVPLTARNRTLGVLVALLDRTSPGRSFSADDQAMLVEVARRAALALDNARLYADAERARRDAEHASRAKDEFLAILGHELRNPLAPIVSALELMDLRNETSVRREREIIRRQVNHLQRLVDDLLDVSRIVRGKVELDRRPVDMETILDKAIEMTHHLFAKQGITLEEETSECWVDGDPVRLAQIVGNLLTNAAKFTPRGGHVSIRLRATAEQTVELVVADTGEGIPSDLLAKVFGLFVQGPQALDRSQGGLGLGLSIVSNLAQLHGGNVTAHSDGPGKGSTFTVTLPAIARPTLDAKKVLDQGPLSTHGRLLIVDDNEDAAEMLADLLRSSGFEVLVETSAAGALKTADKVRPDLAILDIGLPEMDGYELARALRARIHDPRMRLIAVTGFGRDSDRAQAHHAGFDVHFVKPVMPKALLEEVQRLLRTHEIQ